MKVAHIVKFCLSAGLIVLALISALPALAQPQKLAESTQASAGELPSASLNSGSTANTPVNNSAPIKTLKKLPDSRGQLMQVMLALAAVLAVIFVLAWFFKRFVQPMSFSSQQIKVVSSLALGNKEKLLLTEVNGQQILLGVTAHNISSLKSFNRSELESLADCKPLETDNNTEQPADSDFKSKLSQLLKQPSS